LIQLEAIRSRSNHTQRALVWELKENHSSGFAQAHWFIVNLSVFA